MFQKYRCVVPFPLTRMKTSFAILHIIKKKKTPVLQMDWLIVIQFSGEETVLSNSYQK